MTLQAIYKSGWFKHLKTLGGMALLSLIITNPFGRENPELIRWLPSYAYTFLITASMWLGNGYISAYIDRNISWVEAPVRRITIGVLSMVVYTTLITLLLLEGVESFNGQEFSESSGSKRKSRKDR